MRVPIWRRRSAWLAVVCLAGVLPAVVATLHVLAIVPLASETTALTGIQRFDGAAYAAPLHMPYYLTYTALPYRLSEDGRQTPFPTSADFGVVVRFGGGRFSVISDTIGDTLVFSATDNSDPRSNGRRYTVVRPTPVRRRVLVGLWVAALLVTAGAVVRRRRVVFTFLARPPFGVAALALVTLFAANRLWFFVDYPIPAIHPDSGSYYALADQIGSGVLPNFGSRPPVYPLFLRAVFSVSNRVIAMAMAQSALSLLAGVALAYGAYCWAPWLALPAAGAIAVFLFGWATFEHDTAMLSESVYTSFLMLSFAVLVIGLAGRNLVLMLGVASTSMALTVMTRPAGMFLAVTYALVVAWLCWNRFTRRAILWFAIPFPLLMTLLSAYNARVLGAFVPTTAGEENLAVATFVSWETDPSYPPEVNRSIEKIQEIIRARFAARHIDPGPMSTSWNPDVLVPIFVGNTGAAPSIAQTMGGNYATVGRVWIRRIAFDSIRRRPGVYARFVWAMLYNYFKPRPDYDFRLYLRDRVWRLFVVRQFSSARGNPLMVHMGKELADAAPPPGVILTSTDPNDRMDLNDRIVISPTRLWRVYELTHLLRQTVYEYWAWSWAVFVALMGSTIVLVRTRGRHAGAFALFLITISAVGASLVVSLVGYWQPRYSYPMEWVYGISVVLMPLLFMRRDTPERLTS